MRDETAWMSVEDAMAIAPGLNRGKLADLRWRKQGPPEHRLSDGTVLYDELLFRRWLESTVDWQWVHGCFGDRTRPIPTAERVYVHGEAPLDELRARTYITTAQLLALLPEMLPSNASELRASGVGPRFLRPTPKTIIYIAEDAIWWAENVPGFSGRHERGHDRITLERRPLFTPPIAARRPLATSERARIEGTSSGPRRPTRQEAIEAAAEVYLEAVVRIEVEKAIAAAYEEGETRP